MKSSWYKIAFLTLLCLIFIPFSNIKGQGAGQEDSESLFQTKRQQQHIQEEIAETKNEIKVLSTAIASLKEYKKEITDFKNINKAGSVDTLKKRIQAVSESNATISSLESLFSDLGNMIEANYRNGFWGLEFQIRDKGEPTVSVPGNNVAEKCFKSVSTQIDALTSPYFKEWNQESSAFQARGTLSQLITDKGENAIPEVVAAFKKKEGALLRLIDEYTSQANLDMLKSKFTQIFDAETLKQEGAIEEKQDKLLRLEGREEEIFNKLQSKEEGQFKIDRILVWTLPLYGLLMILMLFIPKFYPDVKVRNTIFSSGIILQLITVYLLTVTILILGISEKISSEVLGTLIGGISGYVLGKNMNNSKSEKKAEE